jgi:formiminotetrahydrofolate cyclodeaminase
MLGAALTIMVVNLTVGKKAWEALEDNIKKQILADFAAIQTLNQELAVWLMRTPRLLQNSWMP